MKTLLKYLVCILLAVGLGLASGWIYQKVEASTITEHFFKDQWKPKSSELDRSIALVEGDSSVDVGAVSGDATIEQEFIIKNEGLRLLEIWLKDAPSDGVTTDLTDSKQKILPNGTYPVLVTIDVAKLGLEPGQDIEQTVTIATSDDENAALALKVVGKIAE